MKRGKGGGVKRKEERGERGGIRRRRGKREERRKRKRGEKEVTSQEFLYSLFIDPYMCSDKKIRVEICNIKEVCDTYPCEY